MTKNPTIAIVICLLEKQLNFMNKKKLQVYLFVKIKNQ